jgi:F-type H+-transporting ATPase subunit delta
MESPAVSPQRKRAVVTQLAKILPLSDLVRRFLFVVIDHRRPALVSEIREAYQQVMDERLGVVRAHIGSARELSGAEREQVRASLARLTGKQVQANFEVRDELIGGVLARIGSTVYDGSVKGQLETLKQRLAGAEK